GASQLGQRGLVAAADVVTHAGRRDEALVGDAAADRLRVARGVVGAEHAELGGARLQAALELLQAPLVDGAECLDRAHSVPPFILSLRDTGRSRTAVCALCRRVPRRLGHGVVWCWRAPERSRTSAPGAETRCS